MQQGSTKMSQGSVWTNTFQMDLKKDTKVYMVSLLVKPTLPQEESFLKGEMIIAATKKLAQLTGNHVYPTGEIAYCLKPLEQEEVVVATHAKGYSMLARPTQSSFLVSEKSQEANRFLSVVLKTYMEAEGYSENGKRSCYFNDSRQPNIIPGRGICIMPGYKMHIDRYFDGSIRLNIDTVFRISSTQSIYHELNLHLMDFYDKDAAKSKFISENILGKCFSVKNDMKKMVLIHGVDSKMSLTSSSPVAGYPSMKSYLENKFSCQLTKSDQLIFYNEKKKKIEGTDPITKKNFTLVRTHYPSEILFALGLKKSQSNDNRLMTEIAQFTKHKPHEKQNLITQFSKSLKMICSDIGLKISAQPKSSMVCKVLSAPKVEVRGQKMHHCENGIINFHDRIYSKEAAVDNFAIIYESEYEFADSFWASLKTEFEKIGAPAKEPTWIESQKSPSLADLKSMINEAKNENCKMVILLLSKKTTELHYSGIKEHADIKAQILTQCVKVNNGKLSQRAYFTKLAYQICSKLGFPLWIIEKPIGLEPKHKTMIVGADVYHQRGKKSVAALIATMDSNYSKFCSVSRVQDQKGQEIMTSMADMLKECIETFKTKLKFLPKRILLYRDGVGDNMFDLVEQHESKVIKEMLEKDYGDEAPKLTMVIVTKRISKKIIKETNTGVINPTSGTIVDTGIVQNALEFFMIAQNVNSGTANPTRYQVLLNECGYSCDVLEAMTYFQTFGYYNWTGAVKVPAVCQYAHKLAYHVGENYKQASPFMKLNLYYL